MKTLQITRAMRDAKSACHPLTLPEKGRKKKKKTILFLRMPNLLKTLPNGLIRVGLGKVFVGKTSLPPAAFGVFVFSFLKEKVTLVFAKHHKCQQKKKCPGHVVGCCFHSMLFYTFDQTPPSIVMGSCNVANPFT